MTDPEEDDRDLEHASSGAAESFSSQPTSSDGMHLGDPDRTSGSPAGGRSSEQGGGPPESAPAAPSPPLASADDCATEGPRARVLVVDDHPLFRAGAVAWLNKQAGLTVCGEASSIAETRQAIETSQPDLVLLDLSLPDGEGLQFGRELCQRYPGLRILVLSEGEGTTYAHRALRAGARGYVMKSEGTDTLLTAIQQVLAGEIHVSRMVMAQVIQGLFPEGGQITPDLARLSDRELQVFQLLGSGASVGEMALALHVGRKTIESHRENLKRKLGLRSSKELLRTATLWVAHGHVVPL